MKQSTNYLCAIFLALTLSIGFGASNIYTTAFAQNNALSQDGNDKAEQSIGQSQTTGQAAECLSRADTLAPCNNVALSLNCNGDECGSSNPGERATLIVIFEVDCESTDGTPSDAEVCDQAEQIAPPSAFPNTITANQPNPSTFVGSSTGTVITLGAGHYLIDTDIDQAQDDLEQGLNTDDVSFNIGASGGDCDNPESGTAEGDIRAGESQTCIISTTLVVANGTASS